MTMAGHDDATLRTQLRQMDEQLCMLIAAADLQGDFLLGALLCDAHAHVARRYSELLRS
jgi:hypothetical protein